MLQESLHPASPTVFISSTVSDLRDLRSALSYTLRAQGVNVLISEAADFDVNGDRPAVDECFANIRNSDYYVLVIGGSRGNLFEEGCSITRQEYRVAREALLSRGRPILHFYIRAEVVVAMSGNKKVKKAAGIDDSYHLASFINEVQIPEIENAPSFLTRFHTFEELIESIRGRLNLGRSLSETLARHSLLSELVSNLSIMVRRIGTGARVRHTNITKMRSEISLDPKGLFQPLVLSDEHVLSLALMLVGRISGKNLSTTAIEDSVGRGIFLVFNPPDGTLEESPIHLELSKMLKDMKSLRELDTSTVLPQWDLDLLKEIESKWAGIRGSLAVNCLSVASAFKYYDLMESVFSRHLALCRLLLGVTEDLEFCIDQPLTPLGERQEQKIRAEIVTAEEVIHLVQNDVWPLGTRFPIEIYGKSREEQVRKVTSSMETNLRDIGIDPDQVSNATKKVAEAYLDHSTASREDGIEDLSA